MSRSKIQQDTVPGQGFSRRNFLRLGAVSAGVAGLTLANPLRASVAANHAADYNCILLFLTGGPGHLDTWDPKPLAPVDMRGPFQPIRTSVPGIQLCETFPRMATLVHELALVRAVHHHEAPVHETGHQLMQTGQLFRSGLEYPHYGAVAAALRGAGTSSMPGFVVLPGPLGNTGITISHGQGSGFLGQPYQPRFCKPGVVSSVENENGETAPASAELLGALNTSAEPEQVRNQYGSTEFGQSCLAARRLVERGVRFVTVNMFDTVFDKITWDCHADGTTLRTTLNDYRDTLCPHFDQVYSSLLEDLRQRGLLETTLVAAMGEFGRTPRLNANGGRDHWPGVWSVLFAGGPIRGGQVVGSSDRTGSEPHTRPVTPAEIAATIYHALGIAPDTQLKTQDNRLVPLMTAAAISELF